MASPVNCHVFCTSNFDTNRYYLVQIPLYKHISFIPWGSLVGITSVTLSHYLRLVKIALIFWISRNIWWIKYPRFDENMFLFVRKSLEYVWCHLLEDFVFWMKVLKELREKLSNIIEFVRVQNLFPIYILFKQT